MEVDNRDARQLTAKQAKQLGLPPGSEVEVQHYWFIVPLKEGWRVAYRLFERDGRPIVVELRIFPLAGDVPDLHPGDWSVEVLGFDAPYPKDGLKASLLKDQVIIGRHIYTMLPALLKKYKGPGRALFEALFGGLGIDPDVKPRMPRRGPKGWPDEEYAALASEYVKRCEKESRSPVVDLAASHKMSLSALRAALHRARKRGLLTPQTQGLAGGKLTPRAKALLRTTARKRKTPRKRKKKGKE